MTSTMPALRADFDRTTGIGASEAGAALGLSRFVSPYTLWARKVGLEGDQGVSPVMEWGLRLQDAILGALGDRLADQDLKVRRNSVTQRLPEWPSLFATPDGFVTVGGRRLAAIDAKAPRSDDGWGPDGSTEVPPDYYTQAQAQCLVFDLPVCYLAVLFHGSDFRVYPITANRAAQRRMLEALRAWWSDYIDGSTPPPIEPPARGSTDATLDALFPQGGAGDLAPTPEVIALADRLALAWHNRKQASDAFDALAQQAKAVLGDHDSLVAPACRITWKASKPTQVVAWDRVAEAYQVAALALAQVMPDDATVAFGGGLHLPKAGVQVVLEGVTDTFTTTKDGSRRFLVTPVKGGE